MSKSPKQSELARNLARELKKHIKYGLRYSDGSYETSEASYEPPYTLDQIRKELGDEIADKLSKDPVHKWRADTGIELIHKEPDLKEFKRIVRNWKLMDDAMKSKSDKKSVELFGKGNTERIKELLGEYGVRSGAKSNDFDDIVRAYKDRYGVDLSHMMMHWSKHPVYNNGKRSYELDDDETGGSWVSDSTVRINPNMGPVMKRFGIGGMTQSEFRRRLIAHELAHEIWRKQHDERRDLIKDMLTKAKSEKFTTPYLPTVPKQKLDEETFAEYMSDQLNKKAAIDWDKWPKYEDFQKEKHDKAVELARKIIEEHYKKQHEWGAKTEHGFLGVDDVRNKNRDDVIIRGGKNILRQRRGTCHDLANARMKLLREAGIDAYRVFNFYGVGQDNQGVLGHSMVLFRGDDGKLHFANPHMADKKRRLAFGNFDSLEEAINQHMESQKDKELNGQFSDDDYVEIHDTTDMDIPDKIKFRDFLHKALKGKTLYRQGV